MTSRTNPKKLRGKLLIKGYTVRAFAKTHGFSERTVKAAIRGERRGPVSRRVLEAIHAA
jgi:DNA-binding CsgD family transcriptional regulator